MLFIHAEKISPIDQKRKGYRTMSTHESDSLFEINGLGDFVSIGFFFLLHHGESEAIFQNCFHSMHSFELP